MSDSSKVVDANPEVLDGVSRGLVGSYKVMKNNTEYICTLYGELMAEFDDPDSERIKNSLIALFKEIEKSNAAVLEAAHLLTAYADHLRKGRSV